VSPPGAPDLKTQLDLTADRIAAAVPIAKAIVDGRKAMSLIDKLDLVVDRRNDLNQSLSDGADGVLTRYAEVKLKGVRAFDKHHARLDAEDTAIDKTDAAIDRMSNSLGNSQSSEPSSEKPKDSGA
jgi:hypothetical protein